MATLDLGKIKFTWKNNYSGATAYEKDDVVKYNESVYICKLASTGNLPTNTTYWDLMMQGVNILTTLGDLVTHNGTAPIRFGIGPSGQVLTATASGLAWSAPSGFVGNTVLVNQYKTQYAHAPKDLIGTGNEPWLGEAGGNNLRIASGLLNPRLGPRVSSRRAGYSRHLNSAFLNDRYEYIVRGTTEYGLGGKYAHTHNHANLTSVMAFSGEFGLMRAGDHFVQIHHGGSGSALALTKDGDVFFMGYNNQGIAGAGHTTDVYAWTKVPYLGPDASVSGQSCKIIGLWLSQELNGGEADLVTAYAIDSSYRLWTWGYNANGECGIGNTTSPQTTPQLVSGISNVRMLHARPRNVMAVTNTGQLYTWGWNAQGQLGLGNTTAYTSPQIVSGATNVYDVEVHTGSYYSGGWNYYGCFYYLKNNGELYGCGYNPYGNLGNGNTTNQSAFVRCGTSQTFAEFYVNGCSQYVTVAAIEGNPDTFLGTAPYVSFPGNLYCWGYNGNGQFGNGTTTNSSSPTQPGAICDTTRNRTFTYIAGVTTNSDRVFPRGSITRIFPYVYSEAGTGWMVQDSTGRMYLLGYGVNMGTYRSDNTTVSYSRPVLLPGPWASEDGSACGVHQTIVDYRASAYPYGSSFNLQFLMSDGRVLHMGSNGEGEFSSDAGFNGRFMVINP